MAFKMKAGKEGPMKKNFGIGKNLPDGRSTSSAFQADQRFMGPDVGGTRKEYNALSKDEKNQVKDTRKANAPKTKNKKPTYDKAFENMERVPGKTRGSYNRKNPITGELYADGPQGLSKFKEQAKAYNAKKNKPAAKPAAKPVAKTTTNVKSNLKPPTKLPTIKPKLTPTAGNLLGTMSASIKPKAKDETNIKLKKNKLTGRTKTKTVEKVGDKVIKTKNITDRKGNTKTKTKTRKRTAGKGKQKIAKALTKFASKLLK